MLWLPPALILAGGVEAPAEPVEPPAPEYALRLRPHGGLGYDSEFSRPVRHGLSTHVGGRFLIEAGENRRWGFELDYSVSNVLPGADVHPRFLSFGVVVEMVVRRGFLLGHWTSGTVALDTRQFPFGVVTLLGWEPQWRSRVVPMIAYRTHWVFTTSGVHSNNALSVGVSVRLARRAHD